MNIKITIQTVNNGQNPDFILKHHLSSLCHPERNEASLELDSK